VDRHAGIRPLHRRQYMSVPVWIGRRRTGTFGAAAICGSLGGVTRSWSATSAFANSGQPRNQRLSAAMLPLGGGIGRD
jgi:hypothetical protein